MVDETRIDGSAKNLGETVQETVGNVIGDPQTQVGGKASQIAGTAQDAIGSAADLVNGWAKVIADTVKEKPMTTMAIAVSTGFVLRMLTHTSRRG